MCNLKYTFSLKEINTIAETVLKRLTQKIILLKGDMGVGKTTFVSALLSIMKCHDNVSSPTFSIVNSYKLPQGIGMVHHFDFYRMTSIKEALNIGVEEYFYSDDWVFIEWPNRVTDLIPEPNNTIILSLNEDPLKRDLQLITH